MVKKRTKAFSAILVTIAAALLFPMSMSVAYATPPTTISGKILITGYTVYDTRRAGESDNVFINLSLIGLFTGGISGSFTSESYWAYHNYGLPDRWENVRGVDTISPATVMGKTGSLMFMLNGKSEGTWVIIGGTGELANLHGQGTWSPTGTVPQVAYEGQVHFDP